MDIKSAIRMAGGPKAVSVACGLSHPTVISWGNLNRLPTSEWTGKTQYAKTLADMLNATGVPGVNVHPLDLCPGAGQYMQQPESEAA